MSENNNTLRKIDEQGDGDTGSASCPRNSETPCPLVMRYKKWLFLLCMISLLGCIGLSIFGAIVPYIEAGDFAAIWPAHKGYSVKKVLIFYLSCFLCAYSPLLVQVFRIGDVELFNTHVEVKPYLGFFKVRIILYDSMHIITRNNRALIITAGYPGKCWHKPYQYWKAVYWESIVVTMIDMVLQNPESKQQIIKIVKERAASVGKF